MGVPPPSHPVHLGQVSRPSTCRLLAAGWGCFRGGDYKTAGSRQVAPLLAAPGPGGRARNTLMVPASPFAPTSAPLSSPFRRGAMPAPSPYGFLVHPPVAFATGGWGCFRGRKQGGEGQLQLIIQRRLHIHYSFNFLTPRSSPANQGNLQTTLIRPRRLRLY